MKEEWKRQWKGFGLLLGNGEPSGQENEVNWRSSSEK